MSKWPRVEHPVTNSETIPNSSDWLFYLSSFCDYKTSNGHRFLIVHHFYDLFAL
jgi:hypothetical protein